jgi:hypothetical protein
MTTTINAKSTGIGGLDVTGDASGSLGLQTGGVTAVTIDTSQNVGIGTTSPVYKIDINNAASRLGDTTGGFWQLGASSTASQNFHIGTVASDSTLRFYNGNYGAGTERMRIDSGGTLLVGQTTNPATGTVVIKIPNPSGNGVNAQMASNTGTAYPWSNYNASGTYIGGMTSTSSATAFPTSSDIRLKKNIEPSPSAIDKILTAEVVSHDWINDDAHVEYGFIAQNLQNIIPQAVVKGRDKEDGSLDIPWGVDYSKIVPLLTKAIQEQQTIINDLKARIETLEAK